jgi:hypothetical protein
MNTHHNLHGYNEQQLPEAVLAVEEEQYFQQMADDLGAERRLNEAEDAFLTDPVERWANWERD